MYAAEHCVLFDVVFPHSHSRGLQHEEVVVKLSYQMEIVILAGWLPLTQEPKPVW